MFSFECVHCGRPEILHNTREELDKYNTNGLWPDEEFQEDPPMKLGQGTLEQMLELAEGYSIGVLECPGFAYHNDDKAEVIQVFARCIASGTVWIREFLPHEWQGALDEAVQSIE